MTKTIYLGNFRGLGMNYDISDLDENGIKKKTMTWIKVEVTRARTETEGTGRWRHKDEPNHQRTETGHSRRLGLKRHPKMSLPAKDFLKAKSNQSQQENGTNSKDPQETS